MISIEPGLFVKRPAELKREVLAELAGDPAVAGADIGVMVDGATVTLTGHAGCFAQCEAATLAVCRVDGVQAVDMELEVELPPQDRRSDPQIAEAAQQALRTCPGLPWERIGVSVERGCVTLQGDVEWEAQRCSAAHAVGGLTGVTGLNNVIALRRA